MRKMVVGAVLLAFVLSGVGSDFMAKKKVCTKKLAKIDKSIESDAYYENLRKWRSEVRRLENEGEKSLILDKMAEVWESTSYPDEGSCCGFISFWIHYALEYSGYDEAVEIMINNANECSNECFGFDSTADNAKFHAYKYLADLYFHSAVGVRKSPDIDKGNEAINAYEKAIINTDASIESELIKECEKNIELLTTAIDEVRNATIISENSEQIYLAQAPISGNREIAPAAKREISSFNSVLQELASAIQKRDLELYNNIFINPVSEIEEKHFLSLDVAQIDFVIDERSIDIIQTNYYGESREIKGHRSELKGMFRISFKTTCKSGEVTEGAVEHSISMIKRANEWKVENGTFSSFDFRLRNDGGVEK